MKHKLDFHEHSLKKLDGELGIEDNFAIVEKLASFGTCLLTRDKPEWIEKIRCALLKKWSLNRNLMFRGMGRNNQFDNDRFLVENHFGRMGTLLGMVGRNYRWAERNYDLIMGMCVAFANLHIS